MLSDLRNSIEQVEAEVPITVFHLQGLLDAQSEEEFVKWARQSYDEGTRYLLLDLRGLESVTSAGLRAIQRVYKMYATPGAGKETSNLKIASAPPAVYHALNITGFLKSIPMYESVQSAIDSFKKPTA